MTWLTGKVSAYLGGAMIVVMLGLAIALTITRHTLADRTALVDDTVAALSDAGFVKPKRGHIANDVRALAKDRDTAHGNWLAADQTIGKQSKSINDLHQQTVDLLAKADARAKEIAAVTAQRDQWINEAKKAETRTQKMSAEAEVAECDYVLDQLYNAGF